MEKKNNQGVKIYNQTIKINYQNLKICFLTMKNALKSVSYTFLPVGNVF